MEGVYTTPEGLIVTEKVNIKAFGEVLSAKLAACEESLGVRLEDAACAKGPIPRINLEEAVGEKKYDREQDQAGNESDELVEMMIEDVKPRIKEDTTRFEVELSLVPPDVKLQTIRLRRERVYDDLKLELKYGKSMLRKPALFNPRCKKDLVPGKTVLITIRVYWPFRPLAGNKAVEPKFSQEIVILGQQTLDLLRDLIACVADTAVPHELSERPRDIPALRAKDIYKSGFFFLGETFYVDRREPQCRDHSAGIRQWADARGLTPLGVATMEHTRVEQLTLQLGHPYVYQHQGNCEHLLVVSDVRLLGGADDRAIPTYPYVRYSANCRVKYCMMCGKVPSVWVTEHNSRVPYDPCYFCDYCFRSFNYVDGRKVGSFKAYAFKDTILSC